MMSYGLKLKFKIAVAIAAASIAALLLWKNFLYTPKFSDTYPQEQLSEAAPPIYDTFGRRSEKNFEFVVSTSTKRFSISISFSGKKKDLDLIRPAGAVITAEDSGVQIVNATNSPYLEVINPEAGIWHLIISGSGKFSLKIQTENNETPAVLGTSPFVQQLIDAIDVDKEPGIQFEFVALAGRPGHEGLFPIAGQPTSRKQIAQVRAFDPPLEKVELKLFSLSGRLLSQTVLPRGDGIYSSVDDFVGEVELPLEQFHVAIIGKDKDGKTHEKVLRQTYRVVGVGIYGNLSFDELPRGAKSTLSFLVQNNGPKTTFRIVISAIPIGDTTPLSGEDTDVFGEPVLVTLADNSSRVVEKSIFVPVGNLGIEKYSITASASDINNEENYNGISFDLYVSP